MADTSSIASRMEKLAQLKRMKLARAAENPQNNALPSTDSYLESAQETANVPDLEESIALGDDQHLPIPEAPTAENILMAGSESIDSSDDMDSDIPDTTFSDDTIDDGTDDLAIHAQEFESEFLAKTDEQDLETELPADLLDLEDTSETVEASEAEYTDTFDLTENATSADEHQEIAGIAGISELDMDDEISSLEALNTNDEAPDLQDEISGIADVDQLDESNLKVGAPNFAENEIDPTVLEREFEHETEQASVVPKTSVAEDGQITLTFDNNRSTLLSHVSRQMDCSPEDVVVTALDWYLDALFGEENDEAQSA